MKQKHFKDFIAYIGVLSVVVTEDVADVVVVAAALFLKLLF